MHQVCILLGKKSMTISIIGSGNVGGTLARALISKGYDVLIGARLPLSDKSKMLAMDIGEDRFANVEEAVKLADVVIVSTPAHLAIEAAKSLGDTSGKIIIDTMNVVMGRGPHGFTNTGDAILANTKTTEVVKCFNTTGFENMANPKYNGTPVDMFVAGDSAKGKQIATELAKGIGFGEVWDMGGNDKFFLIEQLANVWINQAIFQKGGRSIAFKLVRR
jgi:8-hydroxy-5-deazaflavin:NADPH oxidoreductase